MQSVISKTGKNRVEICGETPEVWGQRSLLGAISALLGLPESASRAVESVAIAFADHGLNPPSTISTRLAASCGASLPAAVIAGLACFSGPYHGGGIAAAAEFLVRVVAEGDAGDVKRIPGLGHPIHDHDPRVEYLLGQFPQAAHVRALLELSERYGVPPNIAGTSAAILLDAGVPAELCQFPLMLGRVIGLTAHWAEQSKEPQKTIVYDGTQFSA